LEPGRRSSIKLQLRRTLVLQESYSAFTEAKIEAQIESKRICVGQATNIG